MSSAAPRTPKEYLTAVPVDSFIAQMQKARSSSSGDRSAATASARADG